MKHQYAIQTLKIQIISCELEIKKLEKIEPKITSDIMFAEETIKDLKSNIKKLQNAIEILNNA